jgi:hypothetical protein
LVILRQALQNWASELFEQSLKQELMALDPALLPLQQGVQQGGYADGSDRAFSLLTAVDCGLQVKVQVGVFFSEIISGCSCGDDPVTENAYCEFLLMIDKRTAETIIELI